MIGRFKVETIIENGIGHYKITDRKTGKLYTVISENLIALYMN